MKKKTEQLIKDIYFIAIFTGIGLAVLGMGLSVLALGYFIFTGN